MEKELQTDRRQRLLEAGYWPAVADSYLAEGRFSRAADLCQQMLEREPNVVSGRLILGKALYFAGQYTEARAEFVQALKLDSSNLTALKYLGDILFRQGEEAAAMAYYRRIIEIDPHCGGLASSIDRSEPEGTHQVTLKRVPETALKKKTSPLREPAFITETIGDIYRDQGYYQLAHEVYRRLMIRSGNSRIAEKLRATEEKLGTKEGRHETTNR